MCALILEALALPQQGCHTHAAANEQDVADGAGRGASGGVAASGVAFAARETVAQGQKAVELVVGLQTGQLTGAVTDGGDEEPQLIARAVDKMNGDRAAQEGGRGVVDAHFHKLAWLHLGQGRVVREAKQHMLLAQRLHRHDRQVKTVFLHCIKYF